MVCYYLGLDFGTSGARGIVIDENQNQILCLKTADFPAQIPYYWQRGLDELLSQIPRYVTQKLDAIALSATSSTTLLLDKNGQILSEPLWYNDARGKQYLEEIKSFAPENHLVLSATSTLAKIFWWYRQGLTEKATHLLHQADWLGFLLHGKRGVSDYHNALKLGYDVESLSYPSWLENLPFFSLLPNVKAPGETIGEIIPSVAEKYQINPHCLIKAGTTDSIAAFLASGVKTSGEAVTSLGSTLVLKLLSKTKIDDSRYGIYSHRLGDLWLVGGASNTGGAVLKHFFSDDELNDLSQKIDYNTCTNLQYYPLLEKGDRFPLNNPDLEPKLSPRPDNPILFLQGLLEGIAAIESQGYKLLQKLGATPLSQVYTAGGGAKNETWRLIREKYLQVPISISANTEAAYGSALIASGLSISNLS
ncbi:FGGY-family carbohydrate kinase [Cyanobacterium aponinum]|uniref:D-ribulose kinase n=1 Tax=Cyanobacterium aponinum 0216 TaxID=2676140 RepID=A0A844GZZ2_9CHRO|nr:FGGY-family carbohydrate kinase [Cyanobacterium aponinum]MTF40558.1 carbohydrate kinase [Cyanobacterium aponinum 0216]